MKCEVSAHNVSGATSTALNGSISCLGASTSCLDVRTSCLDASISCLAEKPRPAIGNENGNVAAYVVNIDARVDQLLSDAEAMEKRIKTLMTHCKAHDAILENACNASILHASQLVGRCR